MPKFAPLVALLAALCYGSVVHATLAAASPAHPVVQRDVTGSPWSYEQQRQKMMRQVNDVQAAKPEQDARRIRE